MDTILDLIFPFWQPIHDWICSVFFGGQLPSWLASLHELLGVAT